MVCLSIVKGTFYQGARPEVFNQSQNSGSAQRQRITEVLSAEAAARRHPLELAVDLAREDVKNAVHFVEGHGSWDGRWNFPSRSTCDCEGQSDCPPPQARSGIETEGTQ